MQIDGLQNQVAVPSLPQFQYPTMSGYQNGHSSQAFPFDQVIPRTPYPPNMAQVPNLASSIAVEVFDVAKRDIWTISTIRLGTVASPAKKWGIGILLEIPHLIGYTVGAVAIFGLYLIIPMMILLNATLPGNWNKLAIALSIVVVGEIVICVILAKTTPRRKSKHKHQHKHRMHMYEETTANGFRSRFEAVPIPTAASQEGTRKSGKPVPQTGNPAWGAGNLQGALHPPTEARPLPYTKAGGELNTAGIRPYDSVWPTLQGSQFRPGIRRHVLVQP